MSETDQVASLAALTVKAATAYGRPDLAGIARRLETEARAPVARVAVAGDFKRGKSSFVNALLDTDLCTTDETVATTVPTVFRKGGDTSAVVIDVEDDGGETAHEVDPTDLRSVHLDPGRAQRIEIELDRALLGLGIEIVDCPAAAGDGHPGRAATVATARESDAVFYVTGATQPMNRFEIDLVEAIARVCPQVTVVMTRIDIAPEWRRIRAIDTEALERRGLSTEIVPVASPLRLAALARGDRDLNAESGFARIVDLLRDGVAARSAGLHRTRAARTLGLISSELLEGLEHEHESLTSSEAAERELAEVTEARKAVEGLRQASARWQRLLAEGAQDLQADTDHRLSQLGRSILEEATEQIDTIDPGKDWETFEPWLREQMVERVEAVFNHVEEELLAIVERVSAEFGERSVAITDPTDRAGALDELEVTSEFDSDKMQVLGSGMTALRGSYSGLLMFGMLGSLFGFALLNPVTVALGLTVGGKALWDERSRLVKSRRAKATAGVRQFIDQAMGAVRAELRRTIRERQRTIRDAFLAYAEERVAAADASLLKARAAAQATAQERNRRRADVEAEIGRARELHRMITTQLGAES